MDYDVIIVGARVAGSSLATLLGRQGKRVLLLDRDHFPSDTLSTHFLHPTGVELLDRLGVLAEVEAAGFRRITRQRTHVEDAVFEGAMRGPGLYGLCPRRDTLDAVLIRRATAHPTVTFMQRTSVEELIRDNGRVAGIRGRRWDGTRFEARARVVVGADGKHSKVARWVGARAYDEVPALRPMYYAYYRGVAPLTEPACEVFYQDGRIGFLLPMEPGTDCLVLEVRPEEFPAFRADPNRRFEVVFKQLYGMARRLERAKREGPVRGTRGVDNFLREPAGPGWALIGDAACLKDPSTGFGIEDAFRQAFLLADALGATLDGAGWETTMTEYHRRRDQALLPGYRATLAYTRTPDAPAESVAWLHGVLALPGLVRLLATNFPAVAGAGDVFPPALRPTVERSARDFGAAPTVSPAAPARVIQIAS
jgi:2-polyprenyl-6-methoxyphenol hydroxylase-like FAD-dependent oxidoreductase